MESLFNRGVFKLKVVGGDLEASEVALELPAVLGRSADASLSLMHPLVSRHHCELYLEENRVFVRDLGSLNGTFVGSERIEVCPLLPGDLLTVGTVTFRATYALDPDSDGQTTPGSGSGVSAQRSGPRILNRTSQATGAKPVLHRAETEPLRADLARRPTPSASARSLESTDTVCRSPVERPVETAQEPS